MINISMEYPTYQIKAVQCLAPPDLVEVRRLLLEFTATSNPLQVFDLVDDGDIAVLATAIEDVVRVPAPDYPLILKEGRRKVKKDHPHELYDDRDEFVTKNRSDATLLFMYVLLTKTWFYFDMNAPSNGWLPLDAGK